MLGAIDLSGSLASACGSALAVLLMALTLEATAAENPNVVIILADDIGIGDAGPFKNSGSPIATPNIDAIAEAGVTFADAHTPSSVCAPSRYSLLTGNYPFRGRDIRGIWHFTHEPNFLPGQLTLGDVFQAQGYETAYIGKMHLGSDFFRKDSNAIYRGLDFTQVDFTRPFSNGPNDHGFDYSWVIPSGIQDPVYAYFENGAHAPIDPAQSDIVWLDSGTVNGGIVTRAGVGDPNWDSRQAGPTLLSKAINFIDLHHNQHAENKPFFLFYSATAIHVPTTPPDFLDGTPVKGATGVDAKADMIYEFDLQVGKLVEALEARGLADDTIIVVTSDNGGLASYAHLSVGHDSVAGLRGRKSLIYQAGHKVPLMVRWGDGTVAGSHIPPGMQSDQLVSVQDLMATIYDLFDKPIPEDQALDSVSLLPILLGNQPESIPVRNDMVYQSAHWGDQYLWRSMQIGKKELILNSDLSPIELYDLGSDPVEAINLVNSQAYSADKSALLGRFNYIVNQSERTTPSGGGSVVPNLYLNDVSVNESATAAQVEVSLLPAAQETVTVGIQTADGTALAGSDYYTSNAILTFEVGETTQSFDVLIIDDANIEGLESFSVKLSNPSGASIGKDTGTVSINDNDSSNCGTPTFDPAVDKAAIVWKSCTSNTWSVRMTSGIGYSRYQGQLESTLGFNGVTGFSIEGADKVDYSTNPGAIVFDLGMVGPYMDGFDATPVANSSLCFSLTVPGNATVFAGNMKTQVSTPFNPETLGPCSNPSAGLSINNIQVTESDAFANFTVSLSRAAEDPVAVDFLTRDGTAIAGEDYRSENGNLQFAPGEFMKEISIEILDDAAKEETEEFTVELLNANGAEMINAVGVGSISDNEGISCGAPPYDPAVDNGILLWKDCATGNFRSRFSAGGGAAYYRGTVSGTAPYLFSKQYSLEGNDFLNVSGDSKTLSFGLYMVSPWDDGFDFQFPVDTEVCFDVELPASINVLVGPGKTPVAPPFNPNDLSGC